MITVDNVFIDGGGEKLNQWYPRSRVTGLKRRRLLRRKMTMTITYSNTYLTMTGELQKDGTLFETDDHMNREEGDYAGRLFPSVSTWIAALDAETARRAPWFRKHHKLSVEESSVVWVESKQHYMEVRRGSQTKFAATERRHWLTVEEWLQHCQPKAEVPEIPAAVPIAEAVANVPEIPAFDVVTFKKGFHAIMEWIRRAVVVEEKASGVIQICDWLLKMKRRPVFVAWLEETPLWYVTMRAAIQALGSPTPASTAAVTAFLEKF